MKGSTEGTASGRALFHFRRSKAIVHKPGRARYRRSPVRAVAGRRDLHGARNDRKKSATTGKS